MNRQSFNSVEEANAFIEGLDYVDNDHISWEGPYEDGDQWVVEVTEFV